MYIYVKDRFAKANRSFYALVNLILNSFEHFLNLFF